jgi:bifunctional enzyme CysN/CysC
VKNVRIVMVGDVDAGKSTILGRMLVDLGLVTPAKLDELENSSAKRGVPIEYSFLLDAFQLERDQAITLDLTRIWVRTPDAEFVFVDAPGHRELIRNLLSGASEVDAAVMVVAAGEGITQQTRRQALFLRWFGFGSVLVAINKLDLMSDPRSSFEAHSAEVREFLSALGMEPRAIVPVAARSGDNIVRNGPLTQWWDGPTLVDALGKLERSLARSDGPLRFVVQDVYRRDGTRLIAGRIESGTLVRGEHITFWPLQTGARVRSIVAWPNMLESAGAGASIVAELDARVFVDRGAVGSYATDAPELGHVAQTTVVWLAVDPATAGEALRMRLGTREIPVTLQRVEEVVDPDTLAPREAEELRSGDVGVVSLVARELIAADVNTANSSIGRFVLVRGGTIVAGGRIDAVLGRARGEGATNVVAMTSSVGRHERIARNGHAGAVFWLTGLPSAGKSTVAMAVQRMLFERGRQVYVLDGDTLRTSLNVDLGFSDEDRSENVRRTAAVAGVFADAGFVVISALISPFAADRDLARAAYPNGFHEIYVACDLKTAEERDVKGLYQRARRGELAHFTGVSSPYEVPTRPDFVVDTAAALIEESAAALLEYIEANVRSR